MTESGSGSGSGSVSGSGSEGDNGHSDELSRQVEIDPQVQSNPQHHGMHAVYGIGGDGGDVKTVTYTGRGGLMDLEPGQVAKVTGTEMPTGGVYPTYPPGGDGQEVYQVGNHFAIGRFDEQGQFIEEDTVHYNPMICMTDWCIEN